MLMDPTADAGSPHEALFASQLSELEAREAEIAKNLKGLDSSAKTAAIGEDLLVIQEKKLYRAAGYSSIKGYLDAGRNQMSRSRAYQLINHAKHRRDCLATGAPMPANERQARKILKARRNLKLSENEDPGVADLERLDKEFGAWPHPVQAVFADYLVNLATEFVEGRENGDWTRSLGMLERLRRMHKYMRSDDKAMFADALLETAQCFLAEAEHKGVKSVLALCEQNFQNEPNDGNNSSSDPGIDP
jgi:hypothetical protein